MKKFFYLMTAAALLAAFSSCEKKPAVDLGSVVLDGFYVYGEATGNADKVLSQNAMAAGFNEVEKATRAGMYEKYIYLEGGKDFALIENSNKDKKFYGAELTEVNYGKGTEDAPGKNFEDNPDMMILQGKLIIGDTAPKMRVKESGLYHIVLDNNKKGDLAEGAQIIIQKADFGGRGGCNGWGFTQGEPTVGADGVITFTWKDLDFPSKGEFKFSSCNGWKINLDEEGKVKAEVSFGLEGGKLALTSTNITVDKAGLYDLTLVFTPKAGELAGSFSYTSKLTKESDLPEECYLIGDGIKGWNFPGDALAMIPAHSEPGCFWAIRYIKAKDTAVNAEGEPYNINGFKFSQIATDWGKDFTGLGTDTGYTVDGGNCFVAETGLYMIEVDYSKNVVTVSKAVVCGMGDVFGSWDEGKYPFTVSGQTMTATAAAANNLRMYAVSTFAAAKGNWWHREFNIYDGKIVYRGTAGSDQAAVPVTAGQTITLDFNAGTGTIK